jgi:RHS repeat-associated protein
MSPDRPRLRPPLAAALLAFLALGLGSAVRALDDLPFPPFLDETASRLPPFTGATYDAVTGDLDGDADLDAFILNGGPSRLWVNEAGSFADETGTRLPSLSETTFSAALGDVDSDSDLDVLLANASGPKLLINDGSGRFADETSSRLPALSQVTIGVALGDLDADSDLDLVIANRGSQNRILINDGSGIFADESWLRLLPETDRTYDVALFDSDGNGSLDLFFLNQGVASRLLVNDGLGFFADLTPLRLPSLRVEGFDADPVDLNHDGSLDLVLAAGSNGLRFLLNDGSGVFSDETAARAPPLVAYPIRVASGDVDFDADVDLVAASAGQDLLLFNDGTGSFLNEPGKLPADDRRTFGVELFDAEGDLDLDLLLARPRDQSQLLVNDIPFPRLLVTVSPSIIEVSDLVTVDITAFDEDGLSSAVLTFTGPAGDTTVDVLSDLLDGEAMVSFTPTVVGPHAASLVAFDTVGNRGSRSVPFDVLAADTEAPSVSLQIEAPAPLLVGQLVTIRVNVSDDRAVVSKTLTVNGTPVPLTTQGVGTYVPGAPGPYSVIATATDAAGNIGSATDSFTAAADLVAPVVVVSAAPPVVDLGQVVTATVVATDNVGVATRSLAVSGPGITGELPLPLDAAGTATYKPFQPGTYTLTARATDVSGNEGVGTTTFEAQGTPDSTPPSITLVIVPRTVPIGDSVTITVSATDNVGVTETRLEINGTPVGLAGGSVVFTPPALGLYTAVAVARDATGNESTATDTFRAVDPDADDTAPVVAFLEPGDADVLSTLTEIIGTAEDDTLVRYELSAAYVNESTFIPFATGDVSVVDGVLGTFDPTLRENGLYRVRLLAEDVNGLTSVTERVFEVSGEQKVGNFRLSFTDVTFPFAGLPIDVIRTYDSRIKSKRDFGVGWLLETRQSSLQHNRTPGIGWQFNPGSFGLPCLGGGVELAEHATTVKLSDTESYRFALRLVSPSPTLGGCFATAQYVQVDGYTPGATLGILGNTEVFWASGSTEVVEFDSFDTYDVTSVRLTTRDKRIFDVDKSAGLTRAQDRNGNVITFGPGGISSSTGRSVTFTRDASGRIVTITDPKGNLYRYEYDAGGDLIRFLEPTLAVTTFSYDSRHNLLEVLDPRGNRAVRSEYDDDGRLVATIDALGNRMEFENDVGNSQVIRDRLGRVRVLEYDERGNVHRETHPDGTVTTRTHDAKGNELTVTDPLGNTTTFTYDSGNNRTSRTDPEGNTETWTYNTFNQVLTHVDGKGGTTTHTYDANGNLLTETDPNGNVTIRTYDASGNVLSLRDPRGATTLYTYDSSSNLISVRDPLGNVQSFTYDANGNLLTDTRTRVVEGTPQTLVTTNVYDALSRLIRTIHPDGGIVQRGYDENGNLTSVIDALGRETRHEYDELNRRIRTIHPDATTEETQYDAEGQVVGKTDQRGETTTFGYNLRGSLETVTAPGGAVQTREYDDADRLVAVRDENGNRATMELDDAGRTVRRTDPLGNATRFTYDANGNAVSEQNAKGETTTFEYDARRALVRTVYPDGTDERLFYTPTDPAELAMVRDRAGRETLYGYDLMMQLTSVTDPMGNVWSFTYDEVGNRTSQTDPNGHVTQFAYDQRGREIRRTLPGGLAQQRAYDLEGNLISRRDFGGALTTYAYDEMNRLAERLHPDGTSVEWSYTPTGMIASVTDLRGTTGYGYDNRDRLTSVTQPGNLGLAYAYDAGSRLTSLTASAGGFASTENFTYDAANRFLTVTDPLARVYAFTHDATGKRATLTHPNGVQTTYGYNRLDQMTTLVTRNASAAVLQSYNYTVGADGNRSQVVEADGTSRAYLYDAANRLTRETVEGPSGPVSESAYGYDPASNLVQVNAVSAAGSSTRILTYDDRDRLLLDGAISFTWDADGRLLTRSGPDGLVNVWDSESRLVETVHADGTVEEHRYDAAGNRVETAVTPFGGATSVTRYIVDTRAKLSHVVAEVNAGGAIQAHYIRAGDELLSVVRPTGTRFYHADALGSVRRLTDETGAVTDTYTFDALGNLTAQAGTDPNPYLFAGEPIGAQGELYYNRARYLDPATGRFLSMDPFAGDVLQPKTLHRYLYALGNPVNFTDPSGEMGLASVSVSINVQANIRSSNATAALSVLHRVKFLLGQTGRFTFRQLQSMRAANPSAFRNLQNHHLIEKRFWQNMPDLQKIFRTTDDIPSAFLSKADHQLITTAWQRILGKAGTGTHIPYSSLEVQHIRMAVEQVYANWPALKNALLLALL